MVYTSHPQQQQGEHSAQFKPKVPPHRPISINSDSGILGSNSSDVSQVRYITLTQSNNKLSPPSQHDPLTLSDLSQTLSRPESFFFKICISCLKT